MTKLLVPRSLGLVDKAGRERPLPRYTSVGINCEGLAAVEYEGRLGYINEEDVEVIQPQYEAAGHFFGGLARVKKAGLWGAVNKVGIEVIPPATTRCPNAGRACSGCTKAANGA